MTEGPEGHLYCQKYTKYTEYTEPIVRFSASGRTILLVFGEVKFIRIFTGDRPQQRR